MARRGAHSAVIGNTLSATRPVVKRNRRRAGKTAEFLLAEPTTRKHTVSGTPLATPNARSIKTHKKERAHHEHESFAKATARVWKDSCRAVKSFLRFMRDEFIGDPRSFFLKLGHHILIGLQRFIKWFASFSRFLLLPVTVLIIISVCALLSAYTLCVKVTVGGDVVGYVDDNQVYMEAQQEVEAALSERIGDTYQLDEAPQYAVALVPRTQLSTDAQITDTLAVICEDNVGKSFGLFVDGVLIGTYPKEDAINELLENIKLPYRKYTPDEVVMIDNEIEIVQDMYSDKYECTIRELREKLLAKSGEVGYTVIEDDTPQTIASAHGITVDELYEFNPDVDFETIEPGAEVIVFDGEPVVTVQSMRTISYTESIEYEVEEKFTTDLWENTRDVITEGEEGIMEYEAYIVEVDGVEISRQIVAETVLKEPVNETVLVGQKAIAPSGFFLFPITGNGWIITSRYGAWRGTHYHQGLDIAASMGTTIIACDAGVVTIAGWNDWGFGYNVEIDHGNGLKTRYAHCLRVLVQPGQTVYQGQAIAEIGSSGNSTGPHCHFSVEIEEKYVDPELFLP